MLKEFELIESTVPERLYLKAEKLLESAKIVDIKSQERNLHVFELQDDKKYEIEVLTTPKYIKSVSCECEQFHKSNICSHIVACLLRIRAKRQAKKTAPKVRKPAPQNLTIDAIFEHVDVRYIKSFIKQYASKNSKFDSVFKVNFARRVPVDDVEEKYRILIDKIIYPLTKLSNGPTIPSINFFLKQAEELYEQYRDARSLENYQEAYTILLLLLRNVSYLMIKVKAGNPKLTDFYQRLHQQIPLFIRTDMAPELSKKIIKSLLEILALSYYTYPSLLCNIPHYLRTIPSEEVHEDIIRALFQSADLSTIEETKNNSLSLILTISRDKTGSITRIARDVNGLSLQAIVSSLFQLEAYELCQQFVQKCQLERRFHDFDFNTMELLLARKLGHKAQEVNLTIEQFLKTKSPAMLDKILLMESEDMEEQLLKIRRKLQENEAYAKMVCQIMVHQHDYVLLLSYIEEIEQYSLLRAYINEIYEADSQLLELHLRKFMALCVEDISYSYRNHNQMMINVDNIFDSKFSAYCIATLRNFREELLDALP